MLVMTQQRNSNENKYICSTYYVQDTVESACLILTYIVFKIILCCRSNYYHFHFTNEQTTSQSHPRSESKWPSLYLRGGIWLQNLASCFLITALLCFILVGRWEQKRNGCATGTVVSTSASFRLQALCDLSKWQIKHWKSESYFLCSGRRVLDKMQGL